MRKYRSDKSNHHEYCSIYNDLLAGRRHTLTKLLEIGIGDEGYQYNGWGIGASLRAWRDYFPNAQLFGFDIKPVDLGERICTMWADQGQPRTILDAAYRTGGALDVVIDDGSHLFDHQVSSAHVLLPFLAAGGLYIIEDVGLRAAEVAAEIPEPYVCDILECPSPVLGPEQVVVIHR
jgi:hypothetical protein